MNNNLNIFINYIVTMNPSEKELVSNIESDIVNTAMNDFGSQELNDVYRKLDKKIKEEFDNIPRKDVQMNILNLMTDPVIQTVYEGLNEKDRANVDSLKLRDKYLILSKLANERKKEKEEVNEIVYASLNEKEKARVDALKPRDRNLILSRLAVERKKNKDKEKEHVEVPEEKVFTNAHEEMFEQEEEEHETEGPKKDERDKTSPQQRFNQIVQSFYSENPFVKNTTSTPELEVRFGTRGIRALNKNDYDNVIKKLKSSGFYTRNASGEYYLRMNCEFLDTITGRFKTSDVRAEILGLHNIQNYCKNNDIKEIIKSNFSAVSFINKKPAFVNKQKIFPVNFDDFNFRISFVNEIQVKAGITNFITENWKKSKKEIRFINRVTFVNDTLPFNIDLSIVKYGNRRPDKYGRANRGRIIPVYTLDESNVFQNDETYEIEIEVNNNQIGPGTSFNNSQVITESLRNVIKIILGGLQGTQFPISYPEQKQVMVDYMKLIWGKDYEEKPYVESKYFIGPSSITLQTVNLATNNDNSNEPSIRNDFVVTEKADGTRHLMYISDDGRIYLINTNMEVIFTGAKTLNKDCFHSLLDGELILHDKNGKFINLYAAFDIYYINKQDVRNYSFMLLDEEVNVSKSRYYLLKNVIANMKAISILDTGHQQKQAYSMKELLKKTSETETTILSPIRIVCKDFLPLSRKQTIFHACDAILTKSREHRFEYETDGLIFTHAYYGVGAEKIGESGPKTKITWRQSFKWKPPKYNTIDFLVTTVKGPNNDDIVKPIFEEGFNADLSTQLSEYKTIQLRCGFSEKNDGFINPCQDIIDDNLPSFKPAFEDKKENDYLPKQFYPTEPYDSQAGLCNIMLRMDGSGGKQMFTEENEVFTDNMIVEFSYDFNREKGWRWVPLRVRYDKTSEYRKGERQYGNSYKTANENWKSIHNPITEEMLCSGANIPDIFVSEDMYYNKPSGKLMTEAMKNFHNLYVKKLLISSVTKPGETLIDFACGKAGDLSKWIASRLSFVFGIDYSKENLENRLDGSCARYLKARKINKHMPYALFVHGNSAFNVKNGEAMLNDKAKQITSAIFGNGTKDPEKIGKGVARQYGVGEDGFNVSSCQFALHYFLESPDTLQGFVRNLAECTKLNGYFIGTAYDGKLIFNLLKKVKTNESIQIVENGKKIWELTKRYGADNFDDDSSSIGYKIDVYQESINQQISEYLINFDYFDRVMESYGFKIISREEAKEFGFPEGSGLFSELFMNMLEEIKKNKYKEKDYGNAAQMNAFEKKISFLNRYFIYKKMIEVNTLKVQIELGEYSESEMNRNAIESVHAERVGKEVTRPSAKPKIRKLQKKLVLVQATEAMEEQQPAVQEEQPAVQEQQPVTKKKRATTAKSKPPASEKPVEKTSKKAKKLVIVEPAKEE